MSVIHYDPDDMPWAADEVKTILELVPNNTERIHIHFELHDGVFNEEIPFLRQAFPDSRTNARTRKGITQMNTALTKEVIDSFYDLIKNKPSYSINTIRLLYSTTAIDLDIGQEKTIKILGIMDAPNACAIRTAVPNLKRYIHVFDQKDF